MMTLFFNYELKVAVLIAVFYLFWRLLVANETWHRLNRVVLIATAVASFVLPLCVITIHQEVELTQTIAETVLAPADDMPLPSVRPSAMATADVPFDWHLPLTIIYIIGVAVVLSRMILSVCRLRRMAAESEIHCLADGRRIAISDKAKTPFSWWNTVFMNHNDYAEGATALLTHELEHLRLHHSVDVVLVELLTALQWFNPAMWMLRADLRTIHEYEADQRVISHGFNDIQYLHLLIRKAAGQGGYSLANGISHSALKKRVTMIMKPKSNRGSMLKLLALIPIVGAAIALNARTVTDYVYDEPQRQQPVKKGSMPATIKVGNQQIEVVEQTQTDDSPSTVEKGTVVQIKGIVRAQSDGEPIPGTIIKIAGSKVGTVTDRDGKFSLSAKVGDKIEVMYVGMETFTFDVVGENSDIRVDLQKEVEGEKEKIYDVVEKMPEFPGGMSAMMQFLSANLRYPKESQQAGIQGRAIVSFVVEKDGSISGARIVKSVDDALDAEALRIVNAMPKWTPGMQNGKPVNVKYTIPVTFLLSRKDVPESVVIGEQKMSQPSTFSVEIDGVKSDKPMEQTLKDLNSDDILSISIDKTNPEKPLMKITTMNKNKSKAH